MAKSEDVRVRKTNAALVNSLFSLLCTRNFSSISVNELCEEALVSRAAFYTHFVDKYELLQYALSLMIKKMPDGLAGGKSDVLTIVNEFVLAHKREIRSIVDGANESTLELLQEFVIQFILQAVEGGRKEAERDAEAMVLLRFYAGGMITHLKWQNKNRFPADTPFVSEELYGLLRLILV